MDALDGLAFMIVEILASIFDALVPTRSGRHKAKKSDTTLDKQ